MADTIFLIGANGELTEMTATAYDSEALLQDLISEHPDLLGGAQINPDSPRRWLLVRAEMPVPDLAGGVDRWSIDHFFVDQEAIPTLVEVKRATDTRIRREVVGQMLDYAANATVYWSVERARGEFESGCAARQVDPAAELERLVGPDVSADEFWSRVEANLKGGRVRLLFLADQIPPELRRVVEFLNQYMNPTEVLAVEVPQFVGGGQRALVPRVVGQTARAQAAKASSARETGKWDQTSFMETLQAARPDIVPFAQEYVAHAARLGLKLNWGPSKTGSFHPSVPEARPPIFVASLMADGKMWLNFGALRKHPAFADETRRAELGQRFGSVPDLDVREPPTDNYVSVEALFPPDALRAFFEAFDWTVARLRETGAADAPTP